MGNKKNRTKPAKRSSQKKQKHMMEIVNKRRRLVNMSDADELSNSSFHELEIVPLPEKTQSIYVPVSENISGFEKERQLTQGQFELQEVKSMPIREPSLSNAVEVIDDLPELEIAVSEPVKETHVGRRIIEVSHFYKKLQEISNHGALGCGLISIDLIGEKQNGLNSKFTFLCKMCNSKFYVENDCSYENNYPSINRCAVAGMISIGGGHSNLEELSSALNLPLISNKSYQKIHDEISEKWQAAAQETMNEAAEKERNIALSLGKVSKNGIPIIDVIADGCYSKRSYKKQYSALSGAGAIVGKATGEVLFLGVRNKYCYSCDRAEKKKVTAKEHVCFKNYTGLSTGMESEIIVEGFKKSVETHNLIYGRLISDGDSNTYNKILQCRPYQDEGITVEKIECRNHLLRNFCNKLQALQTDTRYLVAHRKLITKSRIMNMRTAIKKAVLKNKNDKFPDVQYLFDDILLCHHHAFGNHARCKIYFCQKHGELENVANDFFSGSLWQRICLIIQNLAGHARSLIQDVDSNIVERYHSIIAKYIGGKRVNFSLKQSYSMRCNAAAVSFNTGKALSRLYKEIVLRSPQGTLKMLELRKLKKKAMNNRYKKIKRRIVFKKSDENYGEECKKPDMPVDVFDKMKHNFIVSLHKTKEERDHIQKQTILQRDSSEWMELRRSLLTASNFGRVIKKRADTNCANLVKDILYKANLDHVSSIKHGQQNEKTALLQLASETGIKIDPCGLYIDETLPFLGATPDGLCGEDTIIEIKCPTTAFKLGLDEAIRQKKVNFWVKNKNGLLEINKNHNWYYQIQGQLHIANKKTCLFGVWAGEQNKIKTEIISKDDCFWQDKMVRKLEKFYKECLLPEIVDPRHTRSLPIRESRPSNVLQNRNQNINPPIQDYNQPTCSRYLNFSDL